MKPRYGLAIVCGLGWALALLFGVFTYSLNAAYLDEREARTRQSIYSEGLYSDLWGRYSECVRRSNQCPLQGQD